MVHVSVFPEKVLASGWWFGQYWIMVDGGTCTQHPIRWFSSPLEALVWLASNGRA